MTQNKHIELLQRVKSLVFSDIIYRTKVDGNPGFNEFAIHSASDNCKYIEDYSLVEKGSRPVISIHGDGEFKLIYQIISYNIHYRILSTPRDWSWTYK